MKYLLLSICTILLFSCSRLTPYEAKELSAEHGSRTIESMQHFQGMATSIDVPGAFNQKGLKFIILDAHVDAPALYFINSHTYPDHFSFLQGALSSKISLQEFKSSAYYIDGVREIIVGELNYYEKFTTSQGSGLFTYEFWSSDDISPENILIVDSLLKAHMKLLPLSLLYHPRGYAQEKRAKESLDIDYISSDKLFANFSFIPFNTGESYGILRDSEGNHHNISDILLLRNIPNTLSHVSGIITEIPQTPLSHINLIAKQNSIPNAYIQNPFDNKAISSLIDQYVHFVVTDTGYILEPATEAEVHAYLEEFRPDSTQTPKIDLRNTAIKPLRDISFDEAVSYGRKTTNLAELGRLLPKDVTPLGFSIPFHYYDTYMQSNGFYDTARAMIAEPAFMNDIAYREERLKAFRTQIKDGIVSPELTLKFEEEIRNKFAEGTSLRCRSSTNNEDLHGFSGAGLYNSYTHHADEGELIQSIKQVWSGLWTFRAFQEREFYRIDHFSVAMAVLVHPNFEDESANGVAVTKNIYDTDFRGFYVNVQVGENLVTNPEEESIPEEFVVTASGQYNSYEVEYIRYSNQTENNKPILSDTHIDTLVYYMELIQDHFSKKYQEIENDNFAMEIEFKITHDNQLIIKQARPWM